MVELAFFNKMRAEDIPEDITLLAFSRQDWRFRTEWSEKQYCTESIANAQVGLASAAPNVVQISVENVQRLLLCNGTATEIQMKLGNGWEEIAMPKYQFLYFLVIKKVDACIIKTR